MAVQRKYREKFRDSVQPHLDQEVLAVGTFRTTGSGTKYAISKTQAGALVYGAASRVGRKRAGGLPEQFLLAVTPSAVHALKYKLKRNGVAVKEEVAAWDRADVELSTKPMQTTTRVTLTLDGGEKVVCDADGMGDNPWADDVIEALSTPAARS